MAWVWQESSAAFFYLGHTDKASWKNIFSAVWISVLCDSCDCSQSFCVTWLELLFDIFSTHTEQGGESGRVRMRLGYSSPVPVPLVTHKISTWVLAGKDFFWAITWVMKVRLSLKAWLGNKQVKLVVLEKKEKITSRGANNKTWFSQTVTLFGAWIFRAE